MLITARATDLKLVDCAKVKCNWLVLGGKNWSVLNCTNLLTGGGYWLGLWGNCVITGGLVVLGKLCLHWNWAGNLFDYWGIGWAGKLWKRCCTCYRGGKKNSTNGKSYLILREKKRWKTRKKNSCGTWRRRKGNRDVTQKNFCYTGKLSWTNETWFVQYLYSGRHRFLGLLLRLPEERVEDDRGKVHNLFRYKFTANNKLV